MKFLLSLCLLLAASCSAFFSPKDVDFQPFLRLQQKAMRSMISANSKSDDPNLISNCFNQYIEDQTSTLGNYNKCYTNCVSTAQTDKNTLTAQSEAMRKDLLARSDGMCNNLYSCDTFEDGLEFFDCYRNMSADSYKIMFTLNSDANTQFNTISTKYNIIDSDLKTCVDDARLEYARELEKCDSDFNICISGDEKPAVSTEKPAVPTEEPAVSTEEPAVSTEEPAVSTEEPAVSTEEPVVSTEEPVVSTEEPAVSTEEPVVSTEEPAVSTEEPAVSTEEPEVTTEKSPEEDISKILPMTFQNALDKLKKFF